MARCLPGTPPGPGALQLYVCITLLQGGFEAFTDLVEKVCGLAVVVFVDQGEDVVDRIVKVGPMGGLFDQFFV